MVTFCFDNSSRRLILVELQPDLMPPSIPATVYLSLPVPGGGTSLSKREALPKPTSRDLRQALLPDNKEVDAQKWLDGVNIQIARVTESVPWSTGKSQQQCQFCYSLTSLCVGVDDS
jgi:hypothetical protein